MKKFWKWLVESFKYQTDIWYDYRKDCGHIYWDYELKTEKTDNPYYGLAWQECKECGAKTPSYYYQYMTQYYKG